MTQQDWTDLDERARRVLAEHGGVASTAMFDAAKITRRQLGALHGRGVVEQARRGWYVDPALPWQVKSAVRVGGQVACTTAADLWGLPVPPGAHERVHVLVDEHGSRFRHHRDRHHVLQSVEGDDRIRFHWGSPRSAVVDGRTSLLDTLLLLVHCVSADWFVAALDAALHTPRNGFALLPRRHRRLLDLVDARAESCIETLLRLALHRRGIVDVVLQAVPHPAYRVDFLIRGRLIVEVDGAAFHDAARDASRDAVLRDLGFRVLRFTYDRVVFDLDEVVAEIETALSQL